MIKEWQTVSRRNAGDFRIFQAEFVEREHPQTNQSSSFVVLNSPTWVNILPITPEKQIVLVRQYRHGIDRICLELPGGMVEKGEDPCDAGMRECLEETGYGSLSRAEHLGSQHPNPAFMTNECFSFVWNDCTLLQKQQLDRNEDIEIVLMTFDQVVEALRKGEISHSLMMNAFFLYWLKVPQSQLMFGR